MIFSVFFCWFFKVFVSTCLLCNILYNGFHFLKKGFPFLKKSMRTLKTLWLGVSQFKYWLAKNTKEDKSTKSKKCQTWINLLNMGRRAFLSWMNGKKRKETSKLVNCFFQGSTCNFRYNRFTKKKNS